MLKSLRLAIAFLTILPLGMPHDVSADDLRRSTMFFPLVGWIIGGILFFPAKAAATSGLPLSVVAVLVVGMAAWLTRGLHLDGLADLLDGLGGGRDPVKRLAIMKDSATGAFGVIGLVLLLLLKTSCLAVLLGGPEGLRWLLFAAPLATARWAMVLLAHGSIYPRRSGTGHPFVGAVKKGDLFVGALMVLPFLMAGPPGFFVVAATLVPALWLRRKASKAFGGVTGDVLGAACELGEAAGWFAAVIYLSGLAS